MRIGIEITRTNAICPAWQEDLRRELELALGKSVELEVSYSDLPIPLKVKLDGNISEARVRKAIEEARDRHQRVIDGAGENRPLTSMKPW